MPVALSATKTANPAANLPPGGASSGPVQPGMVALTTSLTGPASLCVLIQHA
jgi:hypothetical protein